MSLLPLTFRELPSGRVFISNLAGFSHTFGTRAEFERFISAPERCCPTSLPDLKRKLFMAESGQMPSAVRLTAAGLFRRYSRCLRIPGYFLVIPTLRCDHSCEYCQVSRANIDAVGRDLSPEDVTQIVDLLVRYGGESLKIEFQGGEPLLRFDLISAIVRGLLDARGDKKIEIVIASTLSQLSDEILGWAADNGAHFSVSLDGDSFIHNRSRRLPGGSSHLLAVKGIRRVQEALGKGRVSTVTTITRHALAHPERIVEEHSKLGLDGIFVRPLSPYGFAHRKAYDDYSLPEYFEFYKKLLWAVIEGNAATPFIEYGALTHLRNVYGAGSGYIDLRSPAGYVLGALVINYDGNIFGSDEARMLFEQLRVPELILGNIKAEKILLSENDYLVSMLADSFNYDHPGCEKCAYQPYCGVDLVQNLSAFGDAMGDMSRSIFCKYHMGMFDLLIDLYEGDKRARKVFESWLM